MIGLIRRRQREPRDRTQTGPLRGLDQIPTSPLKDTHKWADYVELRCLASIDGQATSGDLAAWLRVDRSEAPDTGHAGDPEAEFDVSQVEDGEGREGLNDSEQEAGAATSALNSDNRTRLAEDVFELLQYRSSLHGESYPFFVTGDRSRLERVDTVTDLHRRYAFLLLRSLGRYVVPHGPLAKDFERLCVPTLAALVPGASVNVFGTAGNGSSEYVGKFKERLVVLARNLGESPQAAIDDVGDEENGDHGLDVVGIASMGDELGGKLAIFAQAACTDAWVNKQDSPSSEAWDQLVLLTNPAVVACCIPFCFRNAQGRWHNRALVHRRLLIDRRRMLYLLEDYSSKEFAICARSLTAVDAVIALGHVS